MPDFSIEHGRGEVARRHRSAICELYDAVFSFPLFVWSEGDSDSHRETLAEISADDTFEIVLAIDGRVMVGFAYGHRLPASHGWWNDFPQELSPDFTQEWEGRTFALIDLAVREDRRGGGIGGRLLSSLLDSRTEERAVLSVQPTAAVTKGIYEHLGWRMVGRKGPIENVLPSYWDIYVLDLKSERQR